jgi:hypothetical protein
MRLERLDHFLDRDDGTPRREDGLLLDTGYAPHRDVPPAVGLLSVDYRDIGA